MKNRLKFTLLIIILIAIATLKSQAQSISISFSGGLSGIGILDPDNPNAAPIIQRDTSKAQIVGGSFNNTNIGFGILASIYLGESKDFVVPVGFDYYFWRSLERVPISKRTTAYIKHTFDMPTFFLGLNYNFYKFNFANVRAYAGLEFRASFIQQGLYNRRIEYGLIDSTQIVESKTKPTTTRFGGGFKLGFDGELVDNIMINCYATMGVLNLMGRDNARGELFTPIKLNETEESIVPTFMFNLQFLYRL